MPRSVNIPALEAILRIVFVIIKGRKREREREREREIERGGIHLTNIFI